MSDMTATTGSSALVGILTELIDTQESAKKGVETGLVPVKKVIAGHHKLKAVQSFCKAYDAFEKELLGEQPNRELVAEGERLYRQQNQSGEVIDNTGLVLQYLLSESFPRELGDVVTINTKKAKELLSPILWDDLRVKGAIKDKPGNWVTHITDVI